MFDNEIRMEKLTKLGNPLDRLNGIDWELFRSTIENAVEESRHNKCDKRLGGRPAYDSILMFKILVIQKMYNLSDEQAEYQINDRISFLEFLGLSNRVPDFSTIWKFREGLVKAKVADSLFDLFYEQLKGENLIMKTGCIVDASFVEIPKPRNTREENAEIKAGKIPEEWQKDGNRHKLSHKDTDARWTKKRKEVHCGYKVHVKIDEGSKLISKSTFTSANIHDSVEIDKLVDGDDKKVYADSGYVGTEDKLPENVEKIICEKGYRGKPLTEEQKKSNREKSRTRCRVEHVFGYFKNSMNKALNVRCIGYERCKFSVTIGNLVYNMLRRKVLKDQGFSG